MGKTVQLADPRSVRQASVGRKMNKAEATELISRIRQHAGQLWQLVSEAYDRKAWQALGYESWKAYAEQELQMSEQRSYQIVDTGRVMKAIGEVAGDPEVLQAVVVTARETARIKPHLSTFKRELTQALKHDGMPITDAVAEAIYSLPVKEPGAARGPRQPRTIEGVVESSRMEAQEALTAAQQRLLEAAQPGAKKAAVAAPGVLFTATEAAPTPVIPRGKKVCPTCDGHGYV